MTLADEERIHRLLGSRVLETRTAPGGFTNNRRYIARLSDGRSVFVKQAVDEKTAQWLWRERTVYERLNAAFMPALVGFDEDGGQPMLVLEDLSEFPWPPPWSATDVEMVRRTLDELAGHEPPPGLGDFTDRYGVRGWAEVAADPAPFLSLGYCSPEWFDRALPVLAEAAGAARLDGDSVVHLDVRSDNICLRPDRALLVDWNLAATGNPQLDLAFWLPSLHAEGGPAPQEVAGIAPELVAFVAGFFACRAGLPEIPEAPHVRQLQRTQLAIALPWAANALNLPAPHEA